MEKTTKKQPDAPYGRVTKQGVQKLFKNQATSATSQPNTTPSDTVTQEHGGVAEAEALGGVFSLIDPIPTVVGPIGRFPAVPEAFPLHPAIVAFGKRRTGKTFTTRDIFYHCFQDIPFGIVLTRTKMNGFWQVSLIFLVEGEVAWRHKTASTYFFLVAKILSAVVSIGRLPNQMFDIHA